MSTEELMLALTCCAPSESKRKSCDKCPLYHDKVDCHMTMCMNAIELLCSYKASESVARTYYGTLNRGTITKGVTHNGIQD